MVSDQEWKVFDEKYASALKKWLKNPTKGIAVYLDEEYREESILRKNEL